MSRFILLSIGYCTKFACKKQWRTDLAVGGSAKLITNKNADKIEIITLISTQGHNVQPFDDTINHMSLTVRHQYR